MLELNVNSLDPVSELEVLFTTHGKLFQFDCNTGQWKKLGTGVVRLLAEESQQSDHLDQAQHGDSSQFDQRVIFPNDQRVYPQYPYHIYSLRPNPIPRDTPDTSTCFFYTKGSSMHTLPKSPISPKKRRLRRRHGAKTTELFHGNGTTEKAYTWLCTLEQTWKWDADDKEKMYHFETPDNPNIPL
ncbi:hypothetical protein B0H11DRAFT_2282206 [Mycena galericulata]|nr:hypothetical protein B0H11DRAFT_2282206 [Mycena galericulata]